MGETGTLFRDLGRNFKVTSCDVAIIWPDKVNASNFSFLFVLNKLTFH